METLGPIVWKKVGSPGTLSGVTLEYGTISDDGTHRWEGEGWGWQRLRLVESEVLDAVREHFGVDENSAHFLAKGMLNESWQIGDYVLRISRGERDREQIAYEHKVLRELHARMPEIVAPVHGFDGNTLQVSDQKCLTLFPFVHGKLGPDVEPERRIEKTAEMMARAHRASLEAELFEQRPGFYAADDRAGWLWPRLREMLMAEVDTPESRRCFALFDEEIAILDKWLAGQESSGHTLTRAVVQGDTNPRNLIFDGDEIAGVIDWDDCHVSPLVAPVAREAFWPDVDTEAFWRTYLDAGGPLEESDFELMHGFARLAAFFELTWAEHDGHANRFAAERISDTAEEIARMREQVPLA